MSEKWNIRFITDWDEIYSPTFQNQWLQWAESAVNSHVFFHPALCMVWIETYRPIRKLEPLFCIAENNHSIFFLPLVLWHKNWKSAFQKMIVPVGYSDFDYHEPILAGDFQQTDLPEIWDMLLPQIEKELIHLTDQIFISGIKQKSNYGQWITEEKAYSLNNLLGIEGEKELLKTLKGSLRGDILRLIRRLEEKGSLTLHQYNSLTAKEAVNNLNHFLDAHKSRWPKSYKAPGFHLRLLQEGIKSSVISFSELKLNDEVISWHLGFRWRGIFYYYMPAISRDYSVYSPGKIHLYKLITDSIQKGCSTFDLLKGGEVYKSQWSNSSVDLYTYSRFSTRRISKIRNYIALELKPALASIPCLLKSHSTNSINRSDKVKDDKGLIIRIIKKNTWEEVFDPEFQNFWYSFYSEFNNNHVFFHPALATAWIQTYRYMRDITPLFYIIEFRQGKMLLPLIFWKKNWKNGFQKIIVPLGYGDFDYGDPIMIGKIEPFEKLEFWKTLLIDLKSRLSFDIIRISGIHPDSSINFNSIKQFLKCPFIDLNLIKDKETFIPTVSGKIYKEISRRYSRLGELGQIEVTHYNSGTLNKALLELNDMLEIHDKRWPESYKAPEYHSNILKYGIKEGIVHFSTVKLNGTTISWRLGFILSKRYYSYMPAYEPMYSKYSPGKIHLIFCIKYAIENGCEVYDLLRGTEKYKDEWSTGHDLITKIEVRNSRIGSIVRNSLEDIKRKIN